MVGILKFGLNSVNQIAVKFMLAMDKTIIRKVQCLFLLVGLCNGYSYPSYNNDVSGCPNTSPVPWTPDWVIGNDLLCDCTPDDNSLLPTRKQVDEHCKCHSYPKWNGTEIQLYIEYTSVYGQSVVLPNYVLNEADVYKITHTSRKLPEVPSNICNSGMYANEQMYDLYKHVFDTFELFWKQIVILDLSDNHIESLGDINCLERLNTLDLSYNRLTHVSNTSFHKLRLLHKIHFNHNMIKTLDPGTTSSPNLRLFRVFFNNNKLVTLDASNMQSHHFVCMFNYSVNMLSGMSNELDVKFNHSYGQGHVFMKDNAIETFPNLKEILNMEDFSEIGTMLGITFDFTGAPFNCDCNLHPFRSLADEIAKSIWGSPYELKCNKPDKYNDKFVHEVPLDKLICNLSDNENITLGCTYIDIPEHDTLYVNCVDANLHVLPESMPVSLYSERIHLNVSHNRITFIDNVTYLNKLSVLDISYNLIRVLEHEMVLQMENASYIDVSNNPNLRQIPQILQYRNSCTVNGDNVILICDCDTRWISSWLTNRHCPNDNLFECDVDGHGTMIATSLKDIPIDCELEDKLLLLTVMLSGSLATLIFIAALIFHFKYEILVLYLRSRKTSKSDVLPINLYDIYTVLDEGNEQCRKWASCVTPYLEKIGYKVFLPYRDLEFGVVKSNEIIDKIKQSRTFLFILSESFLDNEDAEHEWKYAWNALKEDKSRKIVIVNFDFLSSFDVLHPHIRAYLRVGYTVDFDNWDRDMIPRLIEKIGPPQRTLHHDERVFVNRKKVFDLFQIQPEIHRDYVYENKVEFEK